MNSEVRIVKGKELTTEHLKVINDARKKEFNSSSLINPQPENDDWNKVYFILLDKSNNRLLSFARLHNVRITLNERFFDVLGLATLVALEKGKGYGTKVIREMANYCVKENSIGLGFCNPKLSEFYKNRGFSILRKGGERFIYKDTEGKVITSRFGVNDVIYIPEKNALISELNKNDNNIAQLSRPQW